MGTLLAIGYALVTAIATGYFVVYTGMLGRHRHLIPRLVDAVMAAVSLGVSLILCGWLDTKAMPLYNSKMLSSAVVLFGNPRPPSPHAFLLCSASAFLIGTSLHYLRAPPGLNTQAVALALILLVWKLSGSNFSATVGLAIFLAEGDWHGNFQQPLYFLCFPWFAGHLFLWALAHAFALPRAHVRILLSRRELRRNASGTLLSSSGGMGASAGVPSTATLARMREVFTRLDTSGDGRLDATECKVAFRSVLNLDLAIEECAAIIRGIDNDGDGGLDFDEFCQAVNLKAEQQSAVPLLSALFAAKLKRQASPKSVQGGRAGHT